MAQDGTSAIERACDRCRDRRVKCDKRQPSCFRCEKLGKPCPGYDKKRKFVDEGVSLRKKYQSSSSRTESGDFYVDNHKDGSAAPVANAVTPDVLSLTNDFANQRIPIKTEFNPPSIGHALETTDSTYAPQPNTVQTADPALFPESAYLDDFFDDPSFDPSWFNLEPDVFYGSMGNSCGFIPDMHIIDEVDRDNVMQSTETNAGTPMSGMRSYSNSNLWAPETQLNTSAIIADEREHEMAYLIRHFTEAIGPWMDLFDRDKHFGNLVPLKALRDALLRNAIAAVAAKQLGRVKGAKCYVGIQSQKPSSMEVIEEVPAAEWFYKAANYYDKAIAFSRLYLQSLSGNFSNPPSPDAQSTLSMVNSDDLLVAVSIFSLYESLDNLELGWLQHLAGLKTLLIDQQTQLQVMPSLTVGRLASFWNFARADYQAAYINNQRTFLNTEDLNLWHSCGIQIQDDGSLYKDMTSIKGNALPCRQTVETVAHTLLWLVLKVMNYLASGQDGTPAPRQARWLQLTSQLDDWHSNLPATFEPCAQIRYRLPGRTGTHRSHLTEVFFSMNVVAASLHLYHFARILLLLHRPLQPQDTASPSGIAVFKTFRTMSTEALKHAHQIIGIALGRPHPAVRVEMLLPLYAAGVCLEADEERKILLELLRAIEQDTGCETEARCQKLMKQWEWELWSQEPESHSLG